MSVSYSVGVCLCVQIRCKLTWVFGPILITVIRTWVFHRHLRVKLCLLSWVEPKDGVASLFKEVQFRHLQAHLYKRMLPEKRTEVFYAVSDSSFIFLQVGLLLAS